MDKIKVPNQAVAPKKRTSTVRSDIVGAVNYSIGTGKHAQDSVVWLTIRWSLCLGVALSLALIIYTWPISPDGVHPPVKHEFPMDHLKSIWSIFVPIVTLALGYMFGKGR